MDIKLNGERVTLKEGATVADLLVQHGLLGKRLAVERNAAIVPRSAYAETLLAPNDALEIVIAVGGG